MRTVVTPAAIAVILTMSALGVAQSNFRLEIEGTSAGFLSSFNPRELTLDTTSRRQEDPDGRNVWWKVMVPGLPWYPATMQIGWNLPDPMLGWLSDSIQGQTYRKTTRVYESKKDSDIISRQYDFFDVYADSVTFPGGTIEPKAPGSQTNIALGFKARGIVISKPGGSAPPLHAARIWNPASFRFKIQDSSLDVVDLAPKKFSPIQISPSMEIEGSHDHLVGSKDIVIVVPGSSYRYINTWFQDTLAAAPILDPADDGARLKRTGHVTYILDDGSLVMLKLVGLGIRSIQPLGTDFEVTVCVERVAVSVSYVNGSER